MHLVLTGLEPCIIFRLGVWNYSWEGEGSQPAQSRKCGCPVCSSMTFMIPLCHQKALFNKGAVLLLLQGPCSCFANEIAWLVSKIRDLLKLLPRKGGGQGVQLSLKVVGSASSHKKLLRMNQSNFWTNFYVNFIWNPRKTLEPPAEKSWVCWIPRKHSCPYCSLLTSLRDSQARGCPSPSQPPSRQMGSLGSLACWEICSTNTKGQLLHYNQGSSLQTFWSLLV